jgi:S-DNA-T family DNA segregation ATPase FtsK/SpoIIIE
MAKKRSRNKRGQLELNLGFDDERLSKIMGIASWFAALFFFASFFSYLFTWSNDQDKVLNVSVQWLFSSDAIVNNWLGRLGAVIAHIFFYKGFGLGAFLLVYAFLLLGMSGVMGKPLKIFYGKLRNALIGMIFASIFLAFVFEESRFPWGGAFGQFVEGWMSSFIGDAGMILFFFSLIAGVLVWVLNPNFNDITFRALVEQLKNKIFPKRTQSFTLEPDEGITFQPMEEEVQPVKKPFAAPSVKTEIALEELEEETETPFETVETGKNLEEVEKMGQENPTHSAPYDPTLDLSNYVFPEIKLMNDYSDKKVEIDRDELESNKDQIIETLLNYKIEITKIRATIGPTVTLYEIIPAAGVRISKIKNLEDDIALSLAALGIRIIAPIPGKGTIGIEVPNKKKQIVSMREVLKSDRFSKAKMDLPLALGKTISNEVLVADLAKMPHLLVAGATGQGKSVGVNAILMSLLYRKHPSQVKLVLIDPKKVELFPYARLAQHFLAYLPDQEEPIVTETTRVIHTLNSLCIEMDTRYDLLKKASARNIREYNEKFVERKLNPEKGHKFLPFIVVIIDEFADMIMTAGKEVELPIGRLAQLSRAVGIHLVIATQRPSVNIITGVIKANFPARIAYKVSAKVDSRTILDAGGADQLIGHGDMLLSVGGDMVRLQGAFVDTPEVERVIDHISEQRGFPEPYYLPEFHGEESSGATGGPLRAADLDDMFEDAARLVVGSQHGSTSMIQRRLKLGYNRAGRIMDQLEAMGIVGSGEGSKAREVLVYDEMELNKLLENLHSNKNQ